MLPTADWAERCTYDEELDGPFILAFDQAVPAPGECKDDWWFWLQWGKRMNPEQWPWADEKEMVLWRLKEFYDFDLTWEEFQEVPVRVVGGADLSAEPVRKKYEKGMLRPDGQPGFPTVTGKIEFSSPAMEAFGYDPVPDYTEPAESPYSTPELAKEYPLIGSTGHRVYSFFHSAWTNVPAQRFFYPEPFVVVHPDDAAANKISDGEWITISSPRGSIISKALVSREAKKGVVFIPRPAWRCPATAGTRPTATCWCLPSLQSRATAPRRCVLSSARSSPEGVTGNEPNRWWRNRHALGSGRLHRMLRVRGGVPRDVPVSLP